MINPLELYLAGAKDRPEIACYLSGRIGAAIEELPEAPRGLRFSERCFHSRHAGELPVMLAPMIDLATHAHIATHVTYLAHDQAGTWRKASVDPAKKIYGSFAGGVIPLMRGASGRWLSDAPDGDVVLLAEGIENALAGAYISSEHPRVLACGAVGNLAGLPLPAALKRVILVEDNDEMNGAVAELRRRAVAGWQAEGRVVEWMRAPRGCKDFCAFLAAELIEESE
jgi:hypothetical protein